MALAFHHLTVHREAFAGFDQHQVAVLQRTDGDVFFTAVLHANRTFRTQGFKGADGAGGLALGAAFQVFAQQHQGDHHRRGFEVQVRRHAWGGGEPFIDTQAVAGTGADRHQQVHIAGAGAHGFPRGDIEARTQDELHRRGQGKLYPGGEHPVQAEGFYQHRQHQGQRQQNARHQRPALAAQAPGLIGVGSGFALGQAGGVAGFVDGGDQHAGVHLALYFDVRALIGQVDADTLHARHFAQRAFDPPGTAGTGHAADGQVKGGGSIHGAVLQKKLPLGSTLTCGEGQARSFPRSAPIVPTLCVGMQPVTLRVTLALKQCLVLWTQRVR